MARIKQTIMQRNFTHMEIREDFLEGDDLELRQGSLKGAKNMRALVSRAATARPGTFFERMLGPAHDLIEVRDSNGVPFGMILNDDSLQIIDSDGSIVFETFSVPWTDATKVWTNNFRERTVLGSEADGIFILTSANGTWTLTDYKFAASVGGELAQPYWAYEQNATIRPSAETGNITVMASEAIWKAKHVGLRIRYGGREIRVTKRINSTKIEGEVISALPPSFKVTVADGSVFRVGEAVIGADTNYQGLIVGIAANVLSVVTQTFFEGPDVGEEISGPAGSSACSAVTPVSPLSSPIWDEPLMSDLRGYPRSAGKVAGRMVLIDFPLVPDLVVLSSARGIEDFDVGAEDDDAIVRQVGDGAPRWLHAVNMGDLLLFSDNGVYNVPARENGVISPNTFNPVLIDEIGANEIKPVKVDDGVVFVDTSGNGISAAFLDGNVYLKWSVRSLTTFHSHLVRNPIALCGPALRSKGSEKYMFAVNGDGTLAAVSWRESLRDEAVGFALWSTQGEYQMVAPLFDGYWAVVNRSVNGATVKFLERFSDDAYLDCTVTSSETSDAQYLMGNGYHINANGEPIIVISPTASHLVAETVTVYARGWDVGDFVVSDDGTVDTEFPVTGAFQMGFNFEAEMEVWPVEAIESPRVGTLTARILQAVVSVQDTLGYEVRCNRTVRRVGAYRIGDDLSVPPEPRTEIRHFTVYGNRDHPEIVVAKRRPGPFRVLAIGQRVQA